MTKSTALRNVLPVALALLLLPGVQGHASPDPLDNEVQLLADDTDDAYAYYDGFDLQDLYVREAYDRDAEEDGLMFRMIVYGGPAPVPVAAEQRLGLSFEAGGRTHDHTITSPDGLAWTGDMKVVETQLVAEEPTGTVEGSIQVWIPLSELGIAPGDAVTDFVWSSYADDDLRDVAPGGKYLPGTGGQGAVDAVSTVVTEAITLAGPQGYTRTSVKPQPNGTVELAVENLITVIGQHVILELPETPGWETRAIDLKPRVAEPGDNPTFTFFVERAPKQGDLTLLLTTDLGGREVLTVPASAFAVEEDGTVDDDATEPTPEPVAEEESPGLPLVALLATLAVAVASKLRRQSP